MPPESRLRARAPNLTFAPENHSPQPSSVPVLLKRTLPTGTTTPTVQSERPPGGRGGLRCRRGSGRPRRGRRGGCRRGLAGKGGGESRSLRSSGSLPQSPQGPGKQRRKGGRAVLFLAAGTRFGELIASIVSRLDQPSCAELSRSRGVAGD